MKKLFSHQTTALDYIGQNDSCRGKRGALFMQMRLGKTLTAIRHIEPLRAKVGGSVLIICPNNVKGTWGDEFDEEGIEDYLIVHGSIKQKEQNLELNFNYIICNFESLQILQLHLYQWFSIILDESLVIANPKNNVTKYLLNYFFHIKSKYILCGEPAPESELQYFNQMIFVWDEFMGCVTYWEFRFKYYNQRGYNWIAKPNVRKEIYQELRKKCFFLTRQEAGIGNVKLYRKIRIPITSSQRKSYNEMVSMFEADGLFTKYAPVKAMYMHKIAGGVNLNLKEWHSFKKIAHIIESLKGELRNEKVLIWCKYKHEWDMILKNLIDNKIQCVSINGDTPVPNRELSRKAFRDVKEIQVSLMTIKSMYRGTNWAAASTSIYYSNEYSWNLRSQSEDRFIGWDDEPKNIIDYCTDKTIDYDIVDILRGKKIGSKFFMSSLYESIIKKGKI